ncbi:l-lysine 6-transaminase [Anaeramoeba ignava]|uniref:L-lysine-epsilon aminotransferase n=1 Tax=Anaeramoeba ignava TaxID=1746090 RepID=A0A9Q0LFR5_ANAIG|nr:l-lysine 6-transaminase [Anaeramoeba ignava]
MTKRLTKEEVDQINPQTVHEVIGKFMLLQGFDYVFDFERSDGCYFFDSKTEKKFLDFFSFFASWAIGYNHPKMKEKQVLEDLARVSQVKVANSGIYTIEMAKFVATFARVCMPKEFVKVFFIDGGTLAVENAMKTAFDWKTKKNIENGKNIEASKVIHFKKAFHGRSGYNCSTTNTTPWKTKYFPQFNWPRISTPVVKFPLEGENLKNVIEAEKIAIKQIKDAIKESSDEIAALLIEPIQGAGGDNHFRPEFIQELRKITLENDIMMVCDEVQTGIGLTGKMWGYQNYGIVPDIVAFGKKAQVCGIIVTDRCLDVEDNVFLHHERIDSTWAGNIVDMVRATRILEIIEEDKLVENADKVGKYLLQKLLELQKKYPTLLSNTRGKGLFCAFDLPNSALRDKFKQLCKSKSLILLGSGPTSIRFRPPLILENKHVDEGAEIIENVLKELCN